jgi:hypothetical protein
VYFSLSLFFLFLLWFVFFSFQIEPRASCMGSILHARQELYLLSYVPSGIGSLENVIRNIINITSIMLI